MIKDFLNRNNPEYQTPIVTGKKEVKNQSLLYETSISLFLLLLISLFLYWVGGLIGGDGMNLFRLWAIFGLPCILLVMAFSSVKEFTLKTVEHKSNNFLYLITVKDENTIKYINIAHRGIVCAYKVQNDIFNTKNIGDTLTLEEFDTMKQK